MDLTILDAVRPGDKLEIHYINKLNQDLILDTVVYDVISNDEILIHNPLIKSKLYMIPLNIRVTVFLKREDIGVIAFDIMLLKRKKVGNVYTIVSKVTSDIQKQQRRQFFRVKVYHDIEIYFMEDEEGRAVDYYIFDPDAVEEKQIDMKASILDISGGGLGLKTRQKIPLNTYVYARLSFLSIKIEVQGKVVRSVDSLRYPGDFEIGIEFKDVPRDIIRKITSYVFSAQQKARRKERD